MSKRWMDWLIKHLEYFFMGGIIAIVVTQIPQETPLVQVLFYLICTSMGIVLIIDFMKWIFMKKKGEVI